MKSVKVPLRHLNETRKKLMEKKIMNMDYKIKQAKNMDIYLLMIQMK